MILKINSKNCNMISIHPNPNFKNSENNINNNKVGYQKLSLNYKNKSIFYNKKLISSKLKNNNKITYI
jgi:hypothetical protein